MSGWEIVLIPLGGGGLGLLATLVVYSVFFAPKFKNQSEVDQWVDFSSGMDMVYACLLFGVMVVFTFVFGSLIWVLLGCP